MMNGYREVYSFDPASMPRRRESIYKELLCDYDFVKPEPATGEDLRLVHGENHIRSVKRNRLIYEVAVLAVGGSLRAAEIAIRIQPKGSG